MAKKISKAVAKKNAVKKVSVKKAVKPATSVKPVKPVKSVKPAKSVKSVKAVKPVKSVKASKPAKTVNSSRSEKPVAVKSVKTVEKTIKRVPPRITRKAPVITKTAPQEYREIDTAKAVAFAMSIAEEMKRSAANIEREKAKEEIKLSRRPTTRAQGKMTEKFPAADLKEFRRRLIEAREKALSGADAMKATGFNESEDREADGGDGTNQTLRLQALGQMGNINRMIQQIEEALHRIEDGSYGVCTSCGQLIRKPRLLNQPFVLTCMECQNEMERLRR